MIPLVLLFFLRTANSGRTSKIQVTPDLKIKFLSFLFMSCSQAQVFLAFVLNKTQIRKRWVLNSHPNYHTHSTHSHAQYQLQKKVYLLPCTRVIEAVGVHCVWSEGCFLGVSSPLVFEAGSPFLFLLLCCVSPLSTLTSKGWGHRCASPTLFYLFKLCSGIELRLLGLCDQDFYSLNYVSNLC